ncbi:Mediator of RNA polymerase II transcription subunit 19 [Fasciola hepatica]|uniref:Mediator of RNA polymerase II transcription subunit 19 n=1 Tax=Fasciola hepatica TaxID=6192 RepID=A0A4E0RAL6_FASHE|nr:Mediator of RNA polymerase II transcription subunit 19 [Fasciola hepatica]
MNSSPVISTTVQNAGNMQTLSSASSMWINKLKIVGSGHNWAVAPCEPFYLMGTEPPAPDAALTGAKNLIEHYGLANSYQKYCSRPLREELSAFLPHLSGNVDVPASTDGSGLLALIERPPIRGKELRKFAPGQLDQAFRLHPGPLPAEYAALFAAAPQSRNPSRTGTGGGQPPDSTNASLCTAPGSRMPATAAPGLSGMGNAYPPRRRRRYEAARGLSGNPGSSGGAGSATTAFGPSGHPTNPFFPGPPPAPVSALVAHGQVPSAPPSSSSSNSSTLQLSHVHSHLPHQPHLAPTGTSTVPSQPPTSVLAVDTGSGSSSRSVVDLPPGLIPVSAPVPSHFQSGPLNSDQSTAPPPPPPPLLAPVHGTTVPLNPRPTTSTGYQGGSDSLGSYPTQPGISAPPVLHSVHPPNVTLASPGTSSQHHYHHHHHHHQFGSSHVPIQPGTEVQSYGRWSSPGRGGSSPPSPDACRARRSEGGLDAERRNSKKKRKDKKRRKERE